MAMGITQALKLQEGPIDALAKLPQQQLISMVQQGRLGADILPIILNEKADMAQRAANMQAAQQPQPPSVTEKNMMINAQADAQQQAQAQQMQMAQAQPQMPMGGIANLPVPESMYGGGEVEGYAGGGIVAFSDGGMSLSDLVSQQQAADPYSSAPTPVSGLSDYMRQIEGLYPGRADYQNLLAEERKYQAEQKARTAGEADQNKWLRLAQMGFGIAGGESPYALTNIGRGSQEALKGYAEDIREQRKQEQAARQARLALAKQEYELGAGDVTTAIGLREREVDRASKEQQAKLDRENRMAIAQIPDKTIQVAEQLRKTTPGLSFLESITQASQALTPRDTYNATRNAVSSAAKDANALFIQTLSVDSKLMEDVKKANAGDKAAADRVKSVKDRIQAEVFKSYQVEGVNLSSGRMGTSDLADPLGLRK